jgi:uncharacterized protein (TIGR02271 family)
MTETTGMQRTVAAFFDKREAAERAEENLIAAGFPRTSVRLIPGNEPRSAGAQPRQSEGFWEALKDFFFPEEDRYTYAEGLRRGGYLVTASASDARYEKALEILDNEGTIDIDERATSWREEGWQGIVPGAAATGTTAAGGREEKIPVIEEELKVGKREVSQGRVRVRSYVIETPVAERVNLREERVSVERRPTDRPITAADDAFGERTIEAEETHEEPVVGKTARVKEEVVLKKDVRDKTENVTDTVRRTDVKVEDERTGSTQHTTRAPQEPRR